MNRMGVFYTRLETGEWLTPVGVEVAANRCNLLLDSSGRPLISITGLSPLPGGTTFRLSWTGETNHVWIDTTSDLSTWQEAHGPL